MNMPEFIALNQARIETLDRLGTESRKQCELFDAWQRSQSVADFQAWEDQGGRVAKADGAHQKARQALITAGFLPPSRF
jgi:hypothetical protein